VYDLPTCQRQLDTAEEHTDDESINVIEDIAKFEKHNNVVAHAAKSMRKDNAM
jgi:hypothetical protein